MKRLKAYLLVAIVMLSSGGAMGHLLSSTPQDTVHYRILCFFSAAVCGVMYYGISKKLMFAWRIGWIFVVGTSLGIVTTTISDTSLMS